MKEIYFLNGEQENSAWVPARRGPLDSRKAGSLHILVDAVWILIEVKG